MSQKKQSSLMDRRESVWELKTGGGLSQRDIAAELDMSVSTVNRDIRWMSDQVLDRLTELAERETTYQIYQLRKIVFEALKAWNKSFEPRTTTVTREKFGIVDGYGRVKYDEEGSPKEVLIERSTSSTITERSPSTAYLTTAMNAMAALRQLLGLNAPDQVVIDWKMELIEAGVESPADFYEDMVNEAYQKLKAAESVTTTETGESETQE